MLIFGCNGFVGTELCNLYKKNNYKVFGCDINDLRSEKIDVFFSHTVLEDNPQLIFSESYDVCVNCAGSASVPYSFQNPFGDYELNTRIVFKILNELKLSDSRARFINLSSAAVYGNPNKLPISEETPLAPISPYGNHKFMSELIVEQYRNYFNIDAISLRIFSAYGPGLRKQIFWDLYQKSMQGNLVHMHGTGKESRDFIFIEDLAEAIYLISIHPGKVHHVYNIANGEEITIQHIVDLFRSSFNKNLQFEFNGFVREGDPTNWCADITKLKELGYKQVVSIETGIERVSKWMKSLK